MRKLTPAVIDAALLARLYAKTPELQSKSWEYTAGYSRTFKDELTRQLVVNQSRRCAYCGSRLLGTKHHRDHIAPKEVHPEFTFYPSNLVLACYHCNTDCKGATDTVNMKQATYDKCGFVIIHPYFDEPSEHIEYVGGIDEILIQVVNGSLKGHATIAMFRLDSTDMTSQRAKDALFDKDLEHLPGQWRDTLVIGLAANIKTKLRT